VVVNAAALWTTRYLDRRCYRAAFWAEAYLNTDPLASALDGVDLALPVGMAVAAGYHAFRFDGPRPCAPKGARLTTPIPD
jgi:hypothetical protein